jgi:hypothetical protein
MGGRVRRSPGFAAPTGGGAEAEGIGVMPGGGSTMTSGTGSSEE